MKLVSSRDNADYKALKKLTESGRERRKAGRIVLDGMHLVEAYQTVYGVPDQIVVSTSGALRAEIAAWLASFPQTKVIVLEDALFATLSEVETPSGILAVVARPTPRQVLSECADTIVLDGVQDPGNVGTILRTLDAFEADGLVLLPGCADPFSPKTVRSSMGAVFRRPVWTCTAETFAQVLRGSGLRLLGAALRDDTVDARAADYTRAVLAIGSEGRGLSDEVLALCDETVRIPMSPRCESLNAAVAASVLLWEAYR